MGCSAGHRCRPGRKSGHTSGNNVHPRGYKVSAKSKGKEQEAETPGLAEFFENARRIRREKAETDKEEYERQDEARRRKSSPRNRGA